MKKLEFTRHIFATLTYSRDYPVHERWESVSKDFNRFIQKYRRLHNCRLGYLRVVEQHKDGYPHIHIILQFPDARIRVENARYFDKKLYARWRVLWTHGHSDYQKPKRSGTGTISYIMKYLTKNTTSKTIWKKLFAPTADVSLSPPTTTFKTVKSTTAAVSMFGVKLATWSRDFDFTPFLAQKKHIALSSPPLVTHD